MHQARPNYSKEFELKNEEYPPSLKKFFFFCFIFFPDPDQGIA